MSISIYLYINIPTYAYIGILIYGYMHILMNKKDKKAIATAFWNYYNSM